MSNLLKKPTAQLDSNARSRFDRFHLKENPFPTQPVNKDSTDERVNGAIFEDQIRHNEFTEISNTFLKHPQSDRNRLRLGYICDTSYIGRGNGKTAFLVNLAHKINTDYCLDISNDKNKCFAVYVVPQAGGRTKTFASFVDLLFSSMLKSGIIDTSLAILRLSAAKTVYPNKDIESLAENDEDLIKKMNNEKWINANGIENRKIYEEILKDTYMERFAGAFPPLISTVNLLPPPFITSKDFEEYYFEELKKGKPRIDFVFSHLVNLFCAADFNGAYMLVDDFERIPDFQTSRQKKDFAVELRSVLFDGPYDGARMGFYNVFLVLHAGVPQLISEAWNASGLGNRYPLEPKSPHWISFEKITREHVSLLLRKYLSAYRTGSVENDYFPFDTDAISKIGEMNEYNAAKILGTCSNLLEKAADEDRDMIDESFVEEKLKDLSVEDISSETGIENQTSIDLNEKARGDK